MPANTDVGALLGSYLPEHLLPRLRAGDFPPPGRAERISAVTMFADVSGFTPLSSALTRLGLEGSERLHQILFGHYSKVVASIQDHGGSIIKFGGDSAAALFPVIGDDLAETALRALRCAAAMQRTIAGYGRVAVPELGETFELRMKVGIAAGEIHQLLLGNTARLEYVAAGGPCDRMAEAEHHASAEEIVVAPEIVPLLGESLFEKLADGYAKLTGEPGSENSPTAGASANGIPPELLRRFVHPAIAEQIESTGGVSMLAEHRKCTVLFLRFDGIDYDRSDAAFEQLQEYFLRLHAVLGRYGGHLNQVAIGDKGSVVHVIFGAPVSYENDEERAARASLELLRDPPPFLTAQRIGMNTGSVFCGNIGSDRRREYTVLGEATNLAARLMGAATDGQILSSRSTATKAERSVPFAPLGRIRVKGVAEPVEIFQPLDAPAKSRGTSEMLAAPPTTPMVGRDAERSEALTALGDVGCAWVHLEGEAGIGKSRLTAELARHLAPERRVFATQAISYSAEVSFGAFEPLVAALLDLGAGDSREARRSALRTRLAEADVDRLGIAIGWWIRSATTAHEGESSALQLVLEAFERLFCSVGEPVLLVVESLEWLDTASEELLVFLAGSGPDSAIRILTTGRPGAFDPAWSERVSSRIVALSPLGPEAIPRLVRDILGGEAEPDVADLVAVHSRGNPLFASELLSHLSASSALRRDPETGRHYFVPGFSGKALPESVTDLLLANLDRLPNAARQILRTAAVLGREFDSEELRTLLPGSPEPALLRGELARLAARGYLEPHGGRWRFALAPVRDVAYESLGFAQRRALHAAIAFSREIAEEDVAPGEDADERAAELAHHWDLAGERENAFAHHRRAAARAEAADAHEPARHHLDRALANVPSWAVGPDATDRGVVPDLLARRARVLERLARFVEAFDDQRRRFALAAASRDLRTMSEACHQMSKEAEALGLLVRAQRLAGRAATFASRAGWETGRLRAEIQVADSLWRRGEVDASLAIFERLRSASDDAAVDAEIRGQLLLSRGAALLRAGRREAALDSLGAALRTFREVPLPALEVKALITLAAVHHGVGDLESSAGRLSEADELCRRIGDRRGLALVTQNRGNVEFERGRLDEAARLFEETGYLARRFGYESLRASAHQNLAAVASNLGRLEDALRQYREAEAIFSRVGSGEALLSRAGIAEVMVALADPAAEAAINRLAGEARDAGMHQVESWAMSELEKLKAGTSIPRPEPHTGRPES